MDERNIYKWSWILMRGGARCAVWPGHSDYQQTQFFEKTEYEALIKALRRGKQLSKAEESFIAAWEGRA